MAAKRPKRPRTYGIPSRTRSRTIWPGGQAALTATGYRTNLTGEDILVGNGAPDPTLPRFRCVYPGSLCLVVVIQRQPHNPPLELLLLLFASSGWFIFRQPFDETCCEAGSTVGYLISSGHNSDTTNAAPSP